MPLLILLPVLGVALTLRKQLKLSDSLAILCAVSGILIGVFLGALTGFLQGSVYALTGLGMFLLLWEFYLNIKDKTLPFSFPFLLLFLVLPMLYWLVHAESKPMFWDEYSHWGIYIREMATTHEFYTGDTNAAHPDYPPGAPLWHYFFTLLPGYSEGAVYLAQFVLLITPLLILFEKINVHQWFWVPALLSLLALGLANFGHGIVSLYTDHILSVWYVGVILADIEFRQNSLAGNRSAVTAPIGYLADQGCWDAPRGVCGLPDDLPLVLPGTSVKKITLNSNGQSSLPLLFWL